MTGQSHIQSFDLNVGNIYNVIKKTHNIRIRILGPSPFTEWISVRKFTGVK